MPIYDREALISGTFKTIEAAEPQHPVQSKFGGMLKDTRSDDEAHRALAEQARIHAMSKNTYDPHTRVGKDFQRAAPPPAARAFGTRDLHSETGAHYALAAAAATTVAVTAPVKTASWMEPSRRR